MANLEDEVTGRTGSSDFDTTDRGPNSRQIRSWSAIEASR